MRVTRRRVPGTAAGYRTSFTTQRRGDPQIAGCEVVWAQVGVEPESVRGKDRLDLSYRDPAARLFAHTGSEPYPLASAVVALKRGEHIIEAVVENQRSTLEVCAAT